jgi:hypothetical protein
MVICPICKLPGKEGEEFCGEHGAKLVPSDSVSSTDASPRAKKASTPATDESHHRDIAERDAQIAALTSELATAHRELKALREGSAPAVEKKSGAGMPASADGRSKPREKALDTVEETEVAPPPPRTYGLLIHIGGVDATGERYAIGEEPLVIARSPKFAKGGIVIKDVRVSNPHARIEVVKDTVFIIDDGSKNGTYLNDPDAKSIDKARLENGDTIYISEKTCAEFVFKKVEFKP